MQCKYLYEHSCIYCLLSIVDTFALSINRLLLLTLSVQNAVGKKNNPKQNVIFVNLFEHILNQKQFKPPPIYLMLYTTNFAVFCKYMLLCILSLMPATHFKQVLTGQTT